VLFGDRHHTKSCADKWRHTLIQIKARQPLDWLEFFSPGQSVLPTLPTTAASTTGFALNICSSSIGRDPGVTKNRSPARV
jgi:hypothetical protein